MKELKLYRIVILILFAFAVNCFSQGVTRIVYQPTVQSSGSDWWNVSGLTCLGAWTPVDATSMSASLTDESSAGASLTNNSSITLSDSGWTASSGNYLTTDIEVADVYTVAVKFSNWPVDDAGVFGCSPSAGKLVGMMPNDDGVFNFYMRSSSSQYTFDDCAKGIVVLTDGELWINGVSEKTWSAVGSISDTNYDMWIFKHRYADAASGYVKAISFYSSVCDSAKAATLYSNLQDVE